MFFLLYRWMLFENDLLRRSFTSFARYWLRWRIGWKIDNNWLFYFLLII